MANSPATSIEKKVNWYDYTQRQKILGGIFLLAAIFIWFVFARSTDAGMQTRFVMTIGGSLVTTPDWVFNSLAVWMCWQGCARVGYLSIMAWIRQATNGILAFVGIMLVFSFLAWGASGGSINFAGMLSVMVIRAVPITIGALAGILSERSGVTNIAIEGMMIAALSVPRSWEVSAGLWVGILASILIGDC